MTLTKKLFSLVVLMAACLWVNTDRVRAEPCSTAEYDAECEQTHQNQQTGCDNYCQHEFGVPAYSVQTTCHWIGEHDETGTCFENHPNDCGCYDYADLPPECECIRW